MPLVIEIGGFLIALLTLLVPLVILL
jgi:hypothetical protein